MYNATCAACFISSVAFWIPPKLVKLSKAVCFVAITGLLFESKDFLYFKSWWKETHAFNICSRKLPIYSYLSRQCMYQNSENKSSWPVLDHSEKYW